MHMVHTGSSPSYLSGLVTATANIPFRKRLRSADINRYWLLNTWLKFGKWCVSHAGHKAWNALSTELQDLTDHSAFRRQLKTFLFERVFTTQWQSCRCHLGVSNGQIAFWDEKSKWLMLYAHLFQVLWEHTPNLCGLLVLTAVQTDTAGTPHVFI